MINKTALREALINAIVHNDYTKEVPPVVEIYADRLSITSYGGLVQGLSEDEFFVGRSMPRNRELMRVFRDLELVEQLGSGIHRILSAYNKDIFKISDNFLEICFPLEGGYVNASEQVTEQVTEQVKRLLKSLDDRMSIKILMDKLNLKHRPTFLYDYLQPAMDMGFIEMTQPDSPKSPTQKYRLTAKGIEIRKQL